MVGPSKLWNWLMMPGKPLACRIDSALTLADLCHLDGLFPLTSVGEEFVHNPLEIPSSTSYRAKTKGLKSMKDTPTTCLAILGCRLLRTICI